VDIGSHHKVLVSIGQVDEEGRFGLSVAGLAVGHTIQVQASTNLETWTVVESFVAVSDEAEIPGIMITSSTLFYRLVIIP